MDEERRTMIADTLHQYRETVSQHNFFLLRTLVEAMEAEPLPPKVEANVAQIVHVREFKRYLHKSLPNSIESPRDLLNDDTRVELVRLGCLDGVVHIPVNLKQREEYFTAVHTRIVEMNVEVKEFPPPDLEYLCSLVSGITGPGLPTHRARQQFHFISPLEYGELKNMEEIVTIPLRTKNGVVDADGDSEHEEEEENELSEAWTDWEIAIAFKIGTGAREWGGSYALYCRNDDNKEWKWRYGVQDEEWFSDVYNTVEEYLGFYAHFREQTVAEVKATLRTVKTIFMIPG